MTKKWKFSVKNLFFGIDSECFETYFKTKISKSKSFPRNFFSGTQSFFGQNSEKMTKSKNFGRIFLVGIYSECLKTTYKPKIENFSPCIFFPRTLSLSAKIVKKWLSQKISDEFFLVGIDPECFTTNFKPRPRKSISLFFCGFFAVTTIHQEIFWLV